MIEKRLVQWYAADSGVDLDIAEREVVPTYVLRLMLEAGLLQHLAFKGGTAIRKLYLGTRDASVLTWTSPRSVKSNRKASFWMLSELSMIKRTMV